MDRGLRRWVFNRRRCEEKRLPRCLGRPARWWRSTCGRGRPRRRDDGNWGGRHLVTLYIDTEMQPFPFSHGRASTVSCHSNPTDPCWVDDDFQARRSLQPKLALLPCSVPPPGFIAAPLSNSLATGFVCLQDDNPMQLSGTSARGCASISSRVS